MLVGDCIIETETVWRLVSQKLVSIKTSFIEIGIAIVVQILGYFKLLSAIDCLVTYPSLH
jgi:hypothetical protein